MCEHQFKGYIGVTSTIIVVMIVIVSVPTKFPLHFLYFSCLFDSEKHCYQVHPFLWALYRSGHIRTTDYEHPSPAEPVSTIKLLTVHPDTSYLKIIFFSYYIRIRGYVMAIIIYFCLFILFIYLFLCKFYS